MKITIFAAGSRGDIQPCLALGIGLRAAGYSVRLAAPANFADFVRGSNLDFAPLRGDVQQIMSSEFGRDFLETGGSNPLRTIGAMRKMIAPVITTMIRDAFEVCLEADALICLGVFSPIGQTFAEILNLPLINVEPTPLLPSREFPAPSWPVQRNLGAAHNNLSGLIMLYSVWLWYGSFVNEFREDHGLPRASARYFYRALRTTPLLGAYSPLLIPHPADWPDSVHVTGDFRLESQSAWQPPDDLRAFLEAGGPPVYIGFGSMSGSRPEELADLVQEALNKSGQRGVLLSGWGGLRARLRPGNVFLLESAPHGWLFPRMAAVVHHGGAGTTAEGLRAGVPAVIIPFAFDQFFWAARIKEKGLGPDPIPRKKLTAGRLAAAICTAVTDREMRRRAADCGAAARAVNGVEQAVQVIRAYFGKPDVHVRRPSHE